MIVSAYQPYFAPFPGFFSKALRSDILVLMDSVQFPQGTTWLNRNRFKNDQGTLWMTVPVWKKGLGLQSINEVRICHGGRWTKKHLASLKTAYAKAPFLEEHLVFLEKIFSEKFEKLIDLNLKIIEYLMEHLRIPAKVQLLSGLGIEAKEPQLSVEICKKLGASHFLAQSSAKKYLDKPAFQKNGVELVFFNPRPPIYPQLWGPFIPNLSAFDLVFNCVPKAHTILNRSRICPKKL
ncbi:MAG: WbqC family protein [Deltaproteobacteria bacterium]|nr:WbqC family protein [Deltaproteobacteria bacterium]